MDKFKKGSKKNKHESITNENIKRGSGIKKTFKNIVSLTKKHIKKFKPKCKKAAIDLAMAVAKELTSDSSSNIDVPRVIPIPKVGGALHLIPIFAGLSATGDMSGGAAGIARAVNAIKIAKRCVQEQKGQNMKIKKMCLGSGMQLKEHHDGLRIHLNKKN